MSFTCGHVQTPVAPRTVAALPGDRRDLAMTSDHASPKSSMKESAETTVEVRTTAFLSVVSI